MTGPQEDRGLRAEEYVVLREYLTETAYKRGYEDGLARLDAARLAEAFRRTAFSVAYDSDTVPEIAEAIAAEYARLSTEGAVR